MSFHIDYVEDLRVDESPFDNLILRDDIKSTIQSIVWSYKQPGSDVKAWSADFIQEKGEGQIFLLHGTPGVGKTCTAGKWFVPMLALVLVVDHISWHNYRNRSWLYEAPLTAINLWRHGYYSVRRAGKYHQVFRAGRTLGSRHSNGWGRYLPRAARPRPARKKQSCLRYSPMRYFVVLNWFGKTY